MRFVFAEVKLLSAFLLKLCLIYILNKANKKVSRQASDPVMNQII
jgi:hypothetical protein